MGRGFGWKKGAGIFWCGFWRGFWVKATVSEVPFRSIQKPSQSQEQWEIFGKSW